MTQISGIQISSGFVKNSKGPLDKKMELTTPNRLSLTRVQRSLGMLCYDTDLLTWKMLITDPVADVTSELDWKDFGNGGSVETPGVLTLTINPESTAYENGVVVSTLNMLADLRNGTTPITQVSFISNNINLLTINNPNPTESYGITNVNVSQSLQLYGVDGTGNLESNTIDVDFVYPYYFGSGVKDLTPTQVASLSKLVVTEQPIVESDFATNNEVCYFAYPAIYGDLTKITDSNGFSILSDWTKRTDVIIGLDGTIQNYNIYEFKHLTSTTMTYTFIK